MSVLQEGVDHYQALPGRRLGVFQRASLWLAADHLLVVHETMTGESYRRFFFRDIRALTIHRTARGARAGLVLLSLAVLNLLPLIALAWDDVSGRQWAWLACGSGVWVVLAIINGVRGPTCEVRMSTSAQEDTVAPLARLRTARRVVETLRPRILAAQHAPENRVHQAGALGEGSS